MRSAASSFRALIGAAALLPLVAEPALAAGCGAKRPPTADSVKHGRREAPGLLASAGAGCEMTDAIFLGLAPRAGADKKAKPELEVFEVSCKGDLGLVLIRAPKEPARAIDCLLARVSGEFACSLPENREAGGDLGALLAATGAQCDPARAAYRGELPAAKRRRYEVVCEDGQDLLLEVSAPRDARPPVASDCMHPDFEKLCQLAGREAKVAGVARRAAPAAAAVCRISDARLVGRVAARKASLYELACGADQPGLMIELSDAGAPARLTPCAQAGASYRLACQLTGKDEVSPRLAQARDPTAGAIAERPAVEWARRPTGEDFARHFPVQALINGVEGRARISCAVMGDGALDDCNVVSEAPMGYGFGEATLRLAEGFRMKTSAGLAGQMVQIPARFLAPCG